MPLFEYAPKRGARNGLEGATVLVHGGGAATQ